MELLKTLCSIEAPSGEEINLSVFLMNHIAEVKHTWKVQPEIHFGPEFQDGLMLVFGKPRTAVFAHMDSIGFTVRYNNELVKIGGPRVENGYRLRGKDRHGDVEATLLVGDDGALKAECSRDIERATSLTFVPHYRETEETIQCCYLDNRLGVYLALELAKTLENGIICFTTYEEHGGGNAEVMARVLHDRFQIRQALILDVTWVTEGVHAGKGTVISMRDSGIPRKPYLKRILALAAKLGVDHQIEVEGSGGSDGNSLQRSPYPFDWCFIGPAEENVHTPDEKVHKHDIQSTLLLYKGLMREL